MKKRKRIKVYNDLNCFKNILKFVIVLHKKKGYRERRYPLLA